MFVRSALLVLVLPACGGYASPDAESARFGPTPSSLARAADDSRGRFDALSQNDGATGGAFSTEEKTKSGTLAGELSEDPAAAPAVRLVRTAQMDVAVRDYAPFERELVAWLGPAGGRIAQAERSAADGQVGYANLVVRVPADHLDALQGWLEERVQVEHLSMSTQDVTAQWVDVEARIANDRHAETRLQQLLATRAGDLADVLAVERELTRVRGEIEAAEGQMRVLSDRVSESTLTLGVRVETPYVATRSPGLGGRMASALAGSVAAMGQAGTGLLVVAAAVSPWLVLLIGLAAVGISGIRYVARRV